MLAGSVTVLLTAGLAGGALAFLSKAACRAGAWNTSIGQFQAHSVETAIETLVA